MRKYSFFFTVAMAIFLAAYSLAAASPANWPVPDYLAAQVKRACADCQAREWITPGDIDSATLRRLVNAPCDRVRIVAIYTLGEIRDREAVGGLVTMLDDQNAHIRRSAAHALGKIGHVGSVGPLVQMMNNQDEDIMTRCTAARSLGRIADLKAVQALRLACQCRERILARAADQALHGVSGLLFLGSK